MTMYTIDAASFGRRRCRNIRLSFVYPIETTHGINWGRLLVEGTADPHEPFMVIRSRAGQHLLSRAVPAIDWPHNPAVESDGPCRNPANQIPISWETPQK